MDNKVPLLLLVGEVRVVTGSNLLFNIPVRVVSGDWDSVPGPMVVGPVEGTSPSHVGKVSRVTVFSGTPRRGKGEGGSGNRYT